MVFLLLVQQLNLVDKKRTEWIGHDMLGTEDGGVSMTVLACTSWPHSEQATMG